MVEWVHAISTIIPDFRARNSNDPEDFPDDVDDIPPPPSEDDETDSEERYYRQEHLQEYCRRLLASASPGFS